MLNYLKDDNKYFITFRKLARVYESDKMVLNLFYNEYNHVLNEEVHFPNSEVTDTSVVYNVPAYIQMLDRLNNQENSKDLNFNLIDWINGNEEKPLPMAAPEPVSRWNQEFKKKEKPYKKRGRPSTRKTILGSQANYIMQEEPIITNSETANCRIVFLSPIQASKYKQNSQIPQQFQLAYSSTYLCRANLTTLNIKYLIKNSKFIVQLSAIAYKTERNLPLSIDANSTPYDISYDFRPRGYYSNENMIQRQLRAECRNIKMKELTYKWRQYQLFYESIPEELASLLKIKKVRKETISEAFRLLLDQNKYTVYHLNKREQNILKKINSNEYHGLHSIFDNSD